VFDDTTLLPLSLGGQHLVSAAIPTSSGVPASVSSAVLNPMPQETYISAAAAAAVDIIPLGKNLLISVCGLSFSFALTKKDLLISVCGFSFRP